MRTEDYIITIARGMRSRRFIWTAPEPITLENRSWSLVKTPYGVQIVPCLAKGSDTKLSAIRVDPEYVINGQPFDLPSDPYNAGSKKIRVSIRLLTPLRAAYSPAPEFSIKPRVNHSGTYTYYIFEGIRYFLSDFQQLPSSYQGQFENNRIFSLIRGLEGFQVTPLRDHLSFKIRGEKSHALKPGQTYLFSEEKFIQGSLQWGKHWWRVSRIPTPPAIPDEDTLDENVLEDNRWLNRISKTISVAMLTFAIGIYTFPNIFPEKKLDVAPIDLSKLTLKQPKLIKKEPKLISVPQLPKPKPAPIQRPISKPIQLKPKAPKKQNPPKKIPQIRKPLAKKPLPLPIKLSHPPKAIPQKPLQQKVATPAAVHPVVKAPLPPVKQVAPQQNIAILKAQQTAKAQATVAQSLSFLTPSKNRPAQNFTTDKSDHKFEKSSGLPSLPHKQPSILSNYAGGGSTDGSIHTHSSRNMNTEMALNGRKSLNDVQGRVALATIDSSSEGNIGNSLSEKGISMTGTGQISEKAVEKALASHLSKFQYCYEKSLLTDGSLSGTVILEWAISLEGIANNIQIVKSQINNNKLHQCLAIELSKIHFPVPKGGPVVIRYPFAFTSSNL